ncbi:MAG: RNA methyltransferase, partial [Corynebacterium sp.]|nr:RNA methyltransferase [Corynebacterium sp.]
MYIADPTDPRLDDIRDLNKSDKRGDGLVIGEGHLVVSRMTQSRYPLRCLVGFENKIADYLDTYGDPGCPIYTVSRETLAAVAGFDMHRGLVAAADRSPELTVEQVIA